MTDRGTVGKNLQNGGFVLKIKKLQYDAWFFTKKALASKRLDKDKDPCSQFVKFYCKLNLTHW